MKKHLCPLLLVLLLLCTGCAKGESAPAETISQGFALTAAIAETVLVDEPGLTVTALSLTPGLREEPELNLRIENRSGRTLTLSPDLESINGFMVEGSLYAEIPDGETLEDAVHFSKGDLLAAGLTDVSDLELRFTVWDENGLYLQTPLLRLETDLAEQVPQPAPVTGTELWRDGDYVLLQYRPEGAYMDPPLVWLYFENHSDSTVYMDSRGLIINGQEADPGDILLYNEGIAPGKKILEEVCLSSAGEEKYRASDITDLSFTLSLTTSPYAFEALSLQDIPLTFTGEAGTLRAPGGLPETAEEVREPSAAVSGDVLSAYERFVAEYQWTSAFDPQDLPHPETYDLYDLGYWTVHDINEDGTPELILIAGNFTTKCLIYTYNDGVVCIGQVPTGYGVGILAVPGEPMLILCEYQGGYEERTGVRVDVPGGTVEITWSLADLPGDSFPLETRAIGDGYAGPAPADPETEEEPPYIAPGYDEDDPAYIPDAEFFMDYIRQLYSSYDLSGLRADAPTQGPESWRSRCTVYLPISYPYAQELRVFTMNAVYNSETQTWEEPSIWETRNEMTWQVTGTWTLSGEGGIGGEELVTLEIYETGPDYAVCSYEIGIVEDTFGVKDYASVVGGGNLPLEGPGQFFGIPMNWQLTDENKGEYEFFLNPEAGVYYRSDNSLNVFLQPMTRIG